VAAVHERIGSRCVEAGVFPPSLDVTAAFSTFSGASLHGAATLASCQRLGPGESPDLLAADTSTSPSPACAPG